MTRAHGSNRTAFALVGPVLLGTLLLGLTACATPTTDITRTADDAVYTASGRFPAARAGILVAQNAALSEGRGICEKQGKRFRALASIAGEDPATGEAIYAVRFRCFVRPGAMPPIMAPVMPPNAPSGPSREPSADRRM